MTDCYHVTMSKDSVLQMMGFINSKKVRRALEEASLRVRRPTTYSSSLGPAVHSKTKWDIKGHA